MKKGKKYPFKRLFAVICFLGMLCTGCKDENVTFLETELEKETSEFKEATAKETEKRGENQETSEEETEKSDEYQKTSMEETAETADFLYVHVCGAVKNPGVYQLQEGSRVFQAVEAAGGLCADASSDSINQAMAVTDGQQIYIPTQAETELLPETLAGGAGSFTQEVSDDGKVNINTADVAQLTTIRGIGEARAQDIIAYREANGEFLAIEDIMNVSGIKEATFEKIKDSIKVK